MANKTTNTSSKKTRTAAYIILGAVAILTLLMLIRVTREGLIGLFGWAICAYLPAALIAGILLLAGKRPSVQPARAAVYALLFVFAVCTLHVLLAKDLIESESSYVLGSFRGYSTVGGLVFGIITVPVILLVKSYAFASVIFFLLTAGFGLWALYPLIAKFGTDKKRERDASDQPAARASRNPLPRENGLHVEELPPANPDYGFDRRVYPPSQPVSREDEDFSILDSAGFRLNRSQSADILFGNKPTPKKSEQDARFSVLENLDSSPEMNRFYTNQGRTSIYNENLQKKFGEQTPEEDYQSRYGDMKVYTASNPAPSPEPRKQPDFGYGSDYGNGHSVTPSSVPPVRADAYTQSSLYQIPAEQTSPRPQSTPAPEQSIPSYFADPAQITRVARSTPPEETPASKLFDAPVAPRREEPAPTPKPTIKDRLSYINTPLDVSEYATLDIMRPVAESVPPTEPEAERQPEENVRAFEPEISPDAPILEPARPVAAEVRREVPKPAPKPQPVAPKPQAVQPAAEVAEEPVSQPAPKKPYKPRKFNFPPIEMLKEYPAAGGDFPPDFNIFKERIDAALEEFNIPAKIITAKRGPAFTRYELELGARCNVRKVLSVEENLKMRLKVKSIRILAPIEGEDAFGIEIPNESRDTVGLRSIIGSAAFQAAKQKVSICFGKNLEGQPYVEDIASMPHLLVAGATGTGKSVFLNCLITSILYKYSPEDVRMILIDPKRVEMAVYRNLPNLLIKETIKEPGQAVNVLRWLCQEMDRRYTFFEQFGCNNIDQYNDEIRDKNTEPKMPRIVLIIDEMADLMIKGKGQVEEYVVRIAQLARAAGIHLVLATQRPTVDVITGIIKSNILARVAFTVKSNLDSRTILDDGGAEKLLGMGDMLYVCKGNPVRIQGAFVSNGEIRAICDYIRENNEGEFDDEIVKAITAEEPKPEPSEDRSTSLAQERENDFEATLKRVLKTFVREKRASVSSAQAKHNIGYIKAKKIVEACAERGYISSEDNGSKPREVLITMDDFNSIYSDDEDNV